MSLVGTPALKGGRYWPVPTAWHRPLVQEAVASVLGQDVGPPFELIVIDDGSTPETHAALQRFGSAIRYARQENQGLNPARNHGLRLIQGDVVAITVDDPSERELPNVGLARFVDPETGATVDVDTSSAAVRTHFAAAVAEEVAARKRLLRRLAIDEVAVTTESGYMEPLLKFFRARETRVRR